MTSDQNIAVADADAQAATAAAEAAAFHGLRPATRLGSAPAVPPLLAAEDADATPEGQKQEPDADAAAGGAAAAPRRAAWPMDQAAKHRKVSSVLRCAPLCCIALLFRGSPRKRHHIDLSCP